ncbi:ankyrin repeat domain-containing protein 50 [Podospora fimiseda]|uniref:Ankyrin repeat domain-containing protein 50 n=1 Tax=Podospora fimiseda TaxID=252190 RepID=A0AAN7H762_9PEZI|nr:ankyrin repeat domain-containing protein 50 [Podospora fimiseda]
MSSNDFSTWEPLPRPNDEENVPTYTEVDDGGLTEWINRLPELTEALDLPLTTYYGSKLKEPPENPPQAWQIVNCFFTAIANKNLELVTKLIQHGFVSPDVTDLNGRTPLIAAIKVGNGQMVCTLIGLGAQVNGYSTIPPPNPYRSVERTPLMYAAANGNLALVKLLMEDFGADDGIIAPDGQLALRLAADAGHREIVEYLPVRRGGAWRRWQASHEVAVRRIKKSGWKLFEFGKFFVWVLPKFFLWSVPNHVLVKPMRKMVKYCWENKHKFGGWCKRQTKEFPGRVKRAAKATVKGVKRVAKGTWELVCEIPGATKRLIKWIWKLIKRIPAAMKVIGVWIWTTLKRFGAAVGNVFLKIVSALHTAVCAVLDFFKNITLKDVWNGITQVFKPIFQGLPKMILAAVIGLGKAVYMAVLILFGFTGQLLIWIVQGLWWLVTFVPRQFGHILSAIWASIAKGYHEIMVWFNPKH